MQTHSSINPLGGASSNQPNLFCDRRFHPLPMSHHDSNLEQCYQLLHLSPDANLEDLDGTYRQLSFQRLRQDANADIQPLKVAYQTIKKHLQSQSPPTPIEPSLDPPHSPANSPESRHADLQPLDRLTAQVRQLGYQAQIKRQEQRLSIGLNAAHVPNAAIAVAKIYTLLATLPLDEFDLADVKTVAIYGLRSSKRAIWRETFAMPKRGLTQDDKDLLSFNNRFSNAIVFPSILLLGLLASVTPFTQILLRGIQIWIHEFGHATVAWLAGRRAIPLPFGWTNVEEARSLFVYCGVLILMGLLFWSGWREQRRMPMVLAVGFAIIQFWLTWLTPADTFRMLLAFGGIGGEFYLSTLLLVSFYFPLPIKWRWEFWRYPVVFGAAFTFLGAFRMWHHISTGAAAIPWGSMWGGNGDAGGDMNILSLDYGWSDDRILQTYNSLGNGCLVVVLGVYLYFMVQQNRFFLFALWQRWLAR